MIPTNEPALLLRFQPTVEILAHRWRNARPLFRGFRLLARGEPISSTEIAEAAGVEIDDVERGLDAARCERDARGRLIDLFGLTLTPTLHRLEIEDRVLFSCCALWAHVLPKLVDATLRVESVDPIRRQVVKLTISPEGLESSEPAESVATLAVATQAAIDADVSDAFCRRVCHFVSRESAAEFCSALDSCHVIELSELAQVAGLLHQAIWSSVEA